MRKFILMLAMAVAVVLGVAAGPSVGSAAASNSCPLGYLYSFTPAGSHILSVQEDTYACTGNFQMKQSLQQEVSGTWVVDTTCFNGFTGGGPVKTCYWLGPYSTNSGYFEDIGDGYPTGANCSNAQVAHLFCQGASDQDVGQFDPEDTVCDYNWRMKNTIMFANGDSQIFYSGTKQKC